MERQGLQLQVSVVVPSHERVTRLRWLLNALEEQTLPRSRWELVVVHDSADGTEELVTTHQLAREGLLRRVRLAPGTGTASVQRNAGWREARAPLIAFTDDDCRPEPDWLAAPAGPSRIGSSVCWRWLPPPQARSCRGPRGPTRTRRRS